MATVHISLYHNWFGSFWTAKDGCLYGSLADRQSDSSLVALGPCESTGSVIGHRPCCQRLDLLSGELVVGCVDALPED